MLIPIAFDLNAFEHCVVHVRLHAISVLNLEACTLYGKYDYLLIFVMMENTGGGVRWVE